MKKVLFTMLFVVLCVSFYGTEVRASSDRPKDVMYLSGSLPKAQVTDMAPFADVQFANHNSGRSKVAVKVFLPSGASEANYINYEIFNIDGESMRSVYIPFSMLEYNSSDKSYTDIYAVEMLIKDLTVGGLYEICASRAYYGGSKVVRSVEVKIMLNLTIESAAVPIKSVTYINEEGNVNITYEGSFSNDYIYVSTISADQTNFCASSDAFWNGIGIITENGKKIVYETLEDREKNYAILQKISNFSYTCIDETIINEYGEEEIVPRTNNLGSVTMSLPQNPPVHVVCAADLVPDVEFFEMEDIYNRLSTVQTPEDAESLFNLAIDKFNYDELETDYEVDSLLLFTGEVIAQAANKTITNGFITISNESTAEAQKTASSLMKKAEKALEEGEIDYRRELTEKIKITTPVMKSVKITLEPSAAMIATGVKIETPKYYIELSPETLAANVGRNGLTITIKESGSGVSGIDSYKFASAEKMQVMQSMLKTSSNLAPDSYSVDFGRSNGENVTIALTPLGGELTHQAIVNKDGEAIGGKYNPATKMLETGIYESGTYGVKNNKKNFSDIATKSDKMKEAINYLAAKGIFKGTTETTFKPDSNITRAEIADSIMRAISKYRVNEDGGFTDVKKGDKYFGAAGSAKRYGIMKGTDVDGTVFSPNVVIPKEQIIVIAARVLRTEGKYKDPNAMGIKKELDALNDKDALPDWGKTDIALALRENLAAIDVNSNFLPKSNMSRGEAALVLYNMFMKIW